MNKFWRLLKITLIVIVAILLSINIVIPFFVASSMLKKHITHGKEWTAEEFGIDSEHFFVTTDDSLRISAWEVKVDTPKAVVICLSGIENPSVTAFFGHARLFANNGYASILMEMRAHGSSDGNTICCGYKEYHDVDAIVKYLKNSGLYNNVPIVVLGLSMGGGVAITSIGEIPEIDGLISLSAYSSWEDMFVEYMAAQVPRFVAKTIRPFVLLQARIAFGERVCQIRPKTEIAKLGSRPALLMHTKLDDEVSFSNFTRIMQNAPPQTKTFVRDINEHFITTEFINPEKDEEYSLALIDFLRSNF